MRKLPIYLDYMATTPVDPEVSHIMMNYLSIGGIFGNAASVTHVFGKMAAQAIEEARSQIALVVNALPEEFVFTSGATEANNLAICGAARFYKRKGRHLITMSTEHKSVLDSFQQLTQEGFETSILSPNSKGLLDIQELVAAIRPDTIMVSIMHVNNEIGVIQDLEAIAAVLADKSIIFHVDAAQSAGKILINLGKMRVDLMSFSAHKNYGPKGIGALYIRHKPRIRLSAMTYGGTQENGLRAGTLPTHQIVGMGSAFALSESLRVDEQARILLLRKKLWQGLCHLPGISLNGDENQRVAGNLNITFPGFEGQALLLALHELAVSTTSACAQALNQPSYVLTSLGLSPQLAQSSIRLSLGRFTTEEEVLSAIKIICQVIS